MNYCSGAVSFQLPPDPLAQQREWLQISWLLEEPVIYKAVTWKSCYLE